MKAIFLLTVQHTGTWWCIYTLRTHPEIKGFAHIRNVVNLYNGKPLIGDCIGNPNGESIARDGITLLHTHWFRIYEKGRWQWDAISDTLVCFIPTLVPLRDPLQSLLTRHNRDAWMYPHGDLLEEWYRLAATEIPLTFFKVSPFDMDEFTAALHSVGLSTPIEWMNTVDTTLRPNTSGDYVLKDAYENRDSRLIEKSYPSMWNYLKKAEPRLRPFLEKRGYTDLIWWS